MHRPIPPSNAAYTYRLATEADQDHARPGLAGALLAFADDVLDSGDARLALDRAFRWGYRESNGKRVSGLQERLHDLRVQRDRLLRQVEAPGFLDDLHPDLDRLDALDGKRGEQGLSALDRLAGRITDGIENPAAQVEFDSLVSRLRAMTSRSSGPAQDEGIHPESRSFFSKSHGAGSARVAQVRRMLFSDGMALEDTADGEWRRGREQRPGREWADIQSLAELDRVEHALIELGSIGGVMELDESKVGKLCGSFLDEETKGWVRDWAEASGALRLHRSRASGSGSSRLPPEVISAIGRDLLRGMFANAVSPITGQHRSSVYGSAGDPGEASKSWEPGQPLDLDLIGTLTHAIRRGGLSDRGHISLRPEDFLVLERTARVAVSTVLAIDRSRSMGHRGAWHSAKKVALAIHELIRQSYPRDTLEVVSFSSSAEPVTIDRLPAMTWDRFEHGTHLQEALALGRRLLRGSTAATRQVVVITDGEPTLATVGDDDVFASQPTTEILEQTMREVIRCTRERIVINIVLLGGEAGLPTFAEQIARVNGGRIFVASNEHLGSFILRDYVMR